MSHACGSGSALRRRAALLAAGLLAATALTTITTTTPAESAPLGTHVCPQHVPVGHFTCFAQRSPGARTAAVGARTPARATVAGFTPSQLQAAYGLTSQAQAQVRRPRVYIVDAYDAPKAESDLYQYRRRWGLPTCTTGNGCFQKLNQRGAAAPLPTRNADWAGETALDLDMASAICPRCDITLIEADSDGNDLLDGVRTATYLGARFVSMSWGGDEDGHEPSYDRAFLNQASGVFYGAATGDDGFGDGTGVYPATSPRVVAVGGTRLKLTSAGAWQAETAWKYTAANGGAGSGCSTFERKPSWQTSAIVPNSACARRAEADMSAVADPATGVAVYNSYYDAGWTEYGGTSAAAPIVVAAAALAGTPFRNSSPPAVVYANRSGLRDITSGGGNGSCGGTALCTAGPGWDGLTGLGSLNGLSALTPGADPSAHVVKVAYPGARTGRVGVPARLQIVAASSPGAALAYTGYGLPRGVSISRSGLISGTPTRAGNYAPVIVATDSTGARAATSFRWPVALVCSARLVSNGGFESGAKHWTETSRIVRTSKARAHRGSRFVRLDGRGHTHTDRLSRTITLPLGCHATLSYYLKIVSKDHSGVGHDRLRVTVNGHTLQKRTNRSAGSTYRRHTITLTRYNGRTITLAWVGRENSTRSTSFYLDDVSIKLRA